MSNVNKNDNGEDIPNIFDLNIEHYTLNELKKILGITDLQYNKSILLKSANKIKENINELKDVGENKKAEIMNFIKKMVTVLENDVNQMDRFRDLWKKINIVKKKIIKKQEIIINQNKTIIENQKKILENV